MYRSDFEREMLLAYPKRKHLNERRGEISFPYSQIKETLET